MPRAKSSEQRRRKVAVALLAAIAALGWLVGGFFWPLDLGTAVQASIRQGSGLRGAAQQLQAAGVLRAAWRLEALGRLLGAGSRIQAGHYELGGALSPYALLRRITSADFRQDKLTIVEGWSFAQLRAALDAHPALRHDSRGMDDAELARRLEISPPLPEGQFFPDTYFFVAGSSDIAVLQRARRVMQTQLDALWAARADGLPLESPYAALILASIVEKETGRAEERPLIAAVFLNRLRVGMRLQTDPTVIYGLGEAFDGDLRRRDLERDGPFNTYTRSGLPPTPIAMPGAAALAATLHPASSRALYFVARGDGSSKFSESLAEHERAVTQYQRRGKP